MAKELGPDKAARYKDHDFNRYKEAWWAGARSDKRPGIDMFAAMMFEMIYGALHKSIYFILCCATVQAD